MTTPNSYPTATSIESSPPRVEVLDLEQIVDEILDAHRRLYSPERMDWIWLPTTRLAVGDTPAAILDRERQTSKDIEIYEAVLANDKLRRGIADRPSPFMKHDWERQDDNHTPVSSLVSLLNPHLLLSLNFKLDANRMTESSTAMLRMSRGRELAEYYVSLRKSDNPALV